MKLYLLIVIQLCLLTSAASRAQTTETEKSTMQFRTLAGDTAPEGIYYEFNKQDIPITVQQDIRSLPFAYNSAKPLLFYKLIPSPDGKQVHEPVVSVDLSAAGTFPLLIFFQDQTAPKKLRIQTMKEDAMSFPGATCRFVNFSQIPLLIGFGSEQFILPSGRVVDRKPSGPTAMITLKAQTQKATIPLLSNNMVCAPRERYLIVGDPSTNGITPVAVKQLTDRILP